MSSSERERVAKAAKTAKATKTRVQVQPASPKPGRVQKALKAGPHGKQTNADGSKFSSPHPHKPTDGGNGSTPDLKGI